MTQQHIESRATCLKCKSQQMRILEIRDWDGEEWTLALRIVCNKCGEVYYTDEVHP